MFIKDIKNLKKETLIALDVLQLSLELGEWIKYQPKSINSDKILSHLAQSPDLFNKFLEWMASQSKQVSIANFSLSHELIQNIRDLKPFNTSNKRIKVLFTKVDSHKVYQALSTGLVQFLPEWLSISVQDKEKKYKEKTCLNECSKFIENSLQNHHSQLSKNDFNGLRPIFAETSSECFKHLIKKIKKHIDQHLGQNGILEFTKHINDKFSFFSILQLDKGINGSQLYHLNSHLKLCLEFCRRLTESIQKNNQKTPEIVSLNKVITLAFLNELGFALLFQHENYLETNILERIRSNHFDQLNLNEINKLEEELFQDTQIKRLVNALEKINFHQLSSILSESPNSPIELHCANQIPELAHLFLKQSLPFKKFSEQTKWIQKISRLLSPNSINDWIPIKNRGHLAYEFLINLRPSHESVNGAYLNYADYVKEMHLKTDPKKQQTEVLIIAWCKHLCFQLSKCFDFNTPFHHFDFKEQEIANIKTELSNRLNLSEEGLISLSKAHVIDIKTMLRQIIPESCHLSQANDVFFKKNHIKDCYYQQVSNFFSNSKFFSGGLSRFHVWMNQLNHLFNSTLIDHGYDFFGKLEDEIRKFCRVMDVKIKPRLMHGNNNAKSYFSHLFEEFDFGEELYCLQYRHIIADVYILDSKAEHLFDRDCTIYLELVFNHLLIEYSHEIWELLKTNSEIARKEVALQLQEKLPSEQLESALLTLKAKLLDNLFTNFDPENEEKIIQNINFGLSHQRRSFKFLKTLDYDYWSQLNPSENMDSSNWMQELQAIFEKKLSSDECQNEMSKCITLLNPINKTLHHFYKFVEFNDSEETELWVHAKEVQESRFTNLMQRYQDKGLALDLTRYKISQNQPLCLSLLKAFSSEAQYHALSQLTHLRPSLLKIFGELLKQFEQELKELLPRCPSSIKKNFKQYLQDCKHFWSTHHLELSQSIRLEQGTLKHLQQLRNQAQELKSSMRIKVEDIYDILNRLKEEDSFFDIQLPQVFIDLGIDQHYLNWREIESFKYHLENNSFPQHSKVKHFSYRLLQLKQAWIIHHKETLYESLKHYLEELSQEKCHQNKLGKPKLSFTLFYHQQKLPEPYQSNFPSIGLECFSEGPSKDGAHQRVVKSSGAGYDQIFNDHFKNFSALAHRNIILPPKKAPYMESFFRLPTDEASVHSIPNSMMKNRFFNCSGLSTIFFFPCKSFESHRTHSHKF